MITDREDGLTLGQKKNVAGARFTNRSSPDNRTNPLREPRRLRFDDCHPKIAINLWHKLILASPDSLLGLLAAAHVYRCNAAAQIFKTNFCKPDAAHH